MVSQQTKLDRCVDLDVHAWGDGGHCIRCGVPRCAVIVIRDGVCIARCDRAHGHRPHRCLASSGYGLATTWGEA